MYIHIGGDTAVRDSSIVSIMDIENTSTSRITKDFLRRAGKDVITVSEQDLPRTFIITKEKDKSLIYISPISSATLYKRAGGKPPQNRKG